MPYTKHNWQTQEPITQAKMQNIEDGIENAHSGLDSRYTKTEINTMVSNINSNVSTAQTTANNALTIAQNVQLNTSGDQALGQIQDATINHEPKFNTLDLRLASIDANVGDAVSYATTSRDELNNAHLGFNSLRDKLNNMDDKTREQTQRITNIKEEVENARRGKSMLVDKITEIDTNISDDKTDIANIKAIIGYPVAANPEKTIQDIIGEANQALTDGIIEAKNYADTQLSNAKVNEIIAAHNGLEDTLSARFGRIETDVNSLEEDVEGINNNVTTFSSTMSDRLDDIEDAVEALQSKSSTTVISEEDFATLQENIESGEEDPNPYIDYIVGPDINGKYYYWKWINDSDEDKWKLISGGGGSGNSSGIICASDAEFERIDPKEENVDYYVLENDNKYHHYRYYNENIIEIGHVVNENTIISDVTSSINTTLNETVANLTSKINRYRIRKSEQNDNNYLELYEFQYADQIPELATDYPNANLISSILLPAGGGGGGGSSTSTKLTVARRTPQNYYVLSSEKTIQLGIFFSSYDETNNELHNGNYTLYRGGTIVDTGELLTDENHLTDSTGKYVSKYFDITKFCQVGVQNFTLVVTDTAGNLERREWRVELVQLSLETEFRDKRTYSANVLQKINVTPFGSGGISKTIIASVDNAKTGPGYITITTTTSGSPQELIIPASILTPGAHLLKIWVEQIIGQKTEPDSSDPIYLDIICIDNTTSNPIIGSIYRRDETNTQDPVEVSQYTTLEIPYYIYDPTDSSPTVIISKTFNNVTTSITENLKDSNGKYIFKGENAGKYSITISCKNSSIIIPIKVNALNYQINPITEGLIFDFNPVGVSNNSVNRMWTNNIEGYENIKFIIPEGESFDWYNGGYQIDENNDSYFCIKSGSRIAINISLFDKDYFKESNVDDNGSIERSGAEFKCIFKTTNVKRSDATFLTCKDNNEIVVTVYGDDVTDISNFKEYLNVVEIYNIQENKVLAVTSLNNENISAMEATYGNGVTHRITNNVDLSGNSIELSYSDEYLKRYQVLDTNNEIYCTYEEEYDSDHGGWIITRIKPVSSKIRNKLGLEMKAHEVNITSRSGVLTTPYSENDKIEFEYNINSKTEGSYILAYEDGVSTLPLLYYSIPGRDNFIHTDPGYIILGSDDCDLHIYRMKFYNKSLTNQQILMNFYADASNGEEMVQRYERNTKLYDDPHSQSGGLTTITPQSVANACPNLKVLMIEAPELTGGKKSFIKETKVRCIQKNGRPEDNWVVFNAYHAGQGTSSDNYGMAGRNLDIIFGFNGVDMLIVPKSDNNYSFDAQYKSTVVTGITNNFDDIGDYNSILTDMLTEYNSLHPNDILNKDDEFDEIEIGNRHLYRNGTGKISLSENSVPSNWFNIKVNIASSENANNALLQKRFDEYLPYLSPAKKRDPKIKNDMEFYNTVIFIREVGTPTEFKEDAAIEASQRPWHFYGIGNIGDSKKTDDTRVNIPGDPNEFCIEISDNGLTNSGFDTGVYYVNNDETQGTTYNRQYGLNSLIKYPISLAEWTNSNNLAHKALYDFNGEKKVINWDKSFEFRYDISTKDGNTIEEEGIAGQLAAQRLLRNKEKFADMYSWVVTCPNDQFANELSNWFIEESPLYWYLFTERYTMIDSRAKNTFYHYGKYYITTAEASGSNIPTLEAELEELTEGTAEYAVKLTELNVARFIYEHSDNFITHDELADAQHNYGYRFDMWDYDNDTALGINNNGKMVFSYGLEDNDKLPNGSWVYNEATSIFWRRIRENCYTKLSTVFNKTRDCWNAENLIREFDNWQQQFPEELWRLDFERKYLRPYLVYSENKYLKDMANGRKKYQRRQFERDMAVYIYSKYNTSSAYEPNDTIEFRTRATSASGLSLAIKPYGTMYINVAFGDTAAVHTKVYAGELISIPPPESFIGADNTQIVIYNASRIQEMGALAGWQLDTMKFSMATKLQKLILGADRPFSNSYYQELTLANPILEELDIRNYTNMNTTLDLTGCSNLKSLKAQGTNIQVITFASGGLLQEVYYPSTITDIYFTNLNHLNSVNLDEYSNLDKIESLDTPYNMQNIINNSINNDLSSININNINWTNITQPILEKLFNLKGTSILKGIIYMSGDIKEGVLIKYRTKWPEPELIIDTNNARVISQYELLFKYTDIEGLQHTYSQYVTENEIPLDPVTQGWLDPPPGMPPTEQYEFFIGEYDSNFKYIDYSAWYDENGYQIKQEPISSNSPRVFTARYLYSRTRQYKVEWYVDDEKVDEKTVRYGQEAVISSDKIPTVIWNSNTQTAKVFNGWNKSSGRIKENLTGTNGIKATWIEGSRAEALQILENEGLNGLNAAQMYAISKLSTSDKINYLSSHLNEYKEIQLGNDFNFSNVNSVQIADDEVVGYDVNTLRYTPKNIKYFDNLLHDNNPSRYPEIKPIKRDKGFTIALDYTVHSINPEHLNSGLNYEYLLTAYEAMEGISKGFIIRAPITTSSSTDIELCWGTPDNRRVIGRRGYRNIIVIRRPPNSKVLYFYFDENYKTSLNITNTITTATLTMSGEIVDSNVPLVLGCLPSYDTRNESWITNTDNSAPADAVVHWGKYWDEDLGEIVSKQIASLCHEKIKFKLIGFDDKEGYSSTYRIYGVGQYSTNTVPTTKLNFAASSLLETQKWTPPSVNQNDAGTSAGGWADSELRTILNDRVYNAFPVSWRSIIAENPLFTYRRQRTAVGSTSYTSSTEFEVDDKIYIPAYKEILNSTDYSISKEAIIKQIPWMDNQYSARQIDTNSTTLLNKRYSRILYVGKTIPDEPNIFYYPLNRNPYNEAEITGITLKSGDLWVISNYTDWMLMYIEKEEFNKYRYYYQTIDGGINSDLVEPIKCIDINGNQDGAWITAGYGNNYYSPSGYYTRTINPSTSSYSFYYIYPNGNMSSYYSYSRRLLLEFSV